MPGDTALETLRDLSTVLGSLRSHQEEARLLRTTHRLLKCFLFFDVCYLISGVTLISLALTSQVEGGKFTMITYGGILGVFASISALCNSLAHHGLRSWKRLLLLPWLIFFLVVQVIITLHLSHNIYFPRVQWRHLLLFLANIAVLTSWRQMYSLFIMMKQQRPQERDVESVVRECLRPLPQQLIVKDSPPKYDELGQQDSPPPEYQEESQDLHHQESPPPEYQECLQEDHQNLTSWRDW